jgi:hypothetical protein
MGQITRQSFLGLISGVALLSVFAAFGAADAQAPPPGRRVVLSGCGPVAYFSHGQQSRMFWNGHMTIRQR